MKHISLAIAAVVALALTGCGESGKKAGLMKDTLQSLVLKKGTPAPTTQAQEAAMIRKALTENPNPSILVQRLDSPQKSILVQIAQTGNYATFATSDRRTMTLRNGMLSATRGLPNDLMSSDLRGVAGYIQGRKPGIAQRVHRYLDGENVTRNMVFDCLIKPEAVSSQVIASGRRNVRIMQERCLGQDGTQIQNTYQVDTATGRILKAKQWASPHIGYLTIQSLR